MFNLFRRWRRSRMGKCLFCEHEAPLRDFSEEYREEHGSSFSSGAKRNTGKGSKGSGSKGYGSKGYGSKGYGSKGYGSKGYGSKGSSRRSYGTPKRKPTPEPKATSAYGEMGTKGFSKATPKKKRPVSKPRDTSTYDEMGTKGFSNYDEMGTKGFSKVTPKKKRPAPKSRRRTQADAYDEMGTKGYVDWADYRGSKGYRPKGSGPKGA